MEVEVEDPDVEVEVEEDADAAESQPAAKRLRPSLDGNLDLNAWSHATLSVNCHCIMMIDYVRLFSFFVCLMYIH